MSYIQIDLSKVKNANNLIPRIGSSIAGIRRNVGLLRWRVDPEVLNRRNVREKLNHIVSELEKVEQNVEKIYTVTEDIIAQYNDSEQKLSAYDGKFE